MTPSAGAVPAIQRTPDDPSPSQRSPEEAASQEAQPDTEPSGAGSAASASIRELIDDFEEWVPDSMMPEQFTRLRGQAVDFLDLYDRCVENPEAYLGEVHGWFDGKAAEVQPYASEMLTSLPSTVPAAPGPEQGGPAAPLGIMGHLESIGVYLGMGIDHIFTDAWTIFVDTLWEQIWPVQHLGADIERLGEDVGDILTHFAEFEFSAGIDAVLALLNDLVTAIGRYYLWFVLAMILIGAGLGAAGGTTAGGIVGTLAGVVLGPAGATGGGLAGALAGAGAGFGFAESVGLGFLVAAATVQSGLLAKAAFDLATTNGTPEEIDADHQQAAGSILSLAIMGIFALIGAGASRLASRLWSGVVGRNVARLRPNVRPGGSRALVEPGPRPGGEVIQFPRRPAQGPEAPSASLRQPSQSGPHALAREPAPAVEPVVVPEPSRLPNAVTAADTVAHGAITQHPGVVGGPLGAQAAQEATENDDESLCDRPPILYIPQEKAIHLAMYRALARSRELVHLIAAQRGPRPGKSQADIWEETLDPKVGTGIPWGVWYDALDAGIPERRILRPTWSQHRHLGEVMQVDHRVEWQVVDPARRDLWHDMANFELLDGPANRRSGPTIQGAVDRERREMDQACPNQNWLTRPMRFVGVDVRGGSTNGERWYEDDLHQGRHVDAWLQLPREGP